MATSKEKDTVLNPLTLRNNVGEELLDILGAHAIANLEKFVGIKNLKNKEKTFRQGAAYSCKKNESSRDS